MIPASGPFARLLRPGRRVVALWAACLVVGACVDSAPPSSARLPVVVVPLAPLAGLVDALAPADAVEVVVLVPSGASPHTHEPSLDELRRAAGARLYLELGHPAFVFERAWLEGLLEGSAAERRPLFEDCPMERDDYHVWLSATCLGEAAGRVATALTSVLPESAPEIEGNLSEFRRRLAAVDSTTARRLDPLRGRSYLVLHPAWGYLTGPYGLTQLSILSHGSGDPGPARIAAIIEQAREADIRLVFVQPQFNQAPARLVAAELGADLESLDPLARDPLAAIDDATAALERALGPGRNDGS